MEMRSAISHRTACQPVCVDVAMTAALCCTGGSGETAGGTGPSSSSSGTGSAAGGTGAAGSNAAGSSTAGNSQQAALAQAQAEQKAPIPAGSGNVIFVGDSPAGTDGECSRWNGSMAWYGLCGMLLRWRGLAFHRPGEKGRRPVYDARLSDYSQYGVNDLSRHNDYITTINRYAQD